MSKEKEIIFRDKNLSLPEEKDILGLTDNLRDMIWNTRYKTQVVDVPGQGATWMSEIDFPDGTTGELGWYRFHDEIGSLVWTNKEEGLKSGNYSALYVDPYNPPFIQALEIKNGKDAYGIKWKNIELLFSLLENKKT